MKKLYSCILWALSLSPLAVALMGCNERPTNAELDKWRQDAIAQNAVLVKQYEQEKKQAEQDWQFVVQGQTATGKPVQLSLSKLEALAKTSVWTKEPHNTSNPDAIVHFRGVAASTLLDEVGVAPNVTEVTFVARDGYRSTVELADLRRYPIIIALERNGEKIPRSDGGPLYLVFPYQTFPSVQQKYPDRFWAFYLTDMVVGTEPIQLKVGEQVFDSTRLAKLPQVTLEETVGYRIGWPVGKAKLYGVRVRDVLAAAGQPLAANSAVIVRGKSFIYRDPERPIRLEASDLNQCDLLLATHWGDKRMPIPAQMGGPITLAPSAQCQTQDERRWVTFVEALEVTKDER